MFRAMTMAATLTLLAGSAFAHGGADGSADHIGQTGDVSHIDRVVEVDMGEMYFDPKEMTFARGETVKFAVTNSGKVVHEFNIGTPQMHKAHEAEMREMFKSRMMTATHLFRDRMMAGGMMHNDSNAVLLEPGESAELIWTFSGTEDEIELACNVPGHRAAGMVGTIHVAGDHD